MEQVREREEPDTYSEPPFTPKTATTGLGTVWQCVHVVEVLTVGVLCTHWRNNTGHPHSVCSEMIMMMWAMTDLLETTTSVEASPLTVRDISGTLTLAVQV